MNLREQAAIDARAFLEDVDGGFSWPIKVTAPGKAPVNLKGFSSDIHQTIDPETGQAVVGRLATIALSMLSLKEAELGVPKGVADNSQRPWIVEFDDVGGASYKFKVVEAVPDRAMMIVVCRLQAYVS